MCCRGASGGRGDHLSRIYLRCLKIAHIVAIGVLGMMGIVDGLRKILALTDFPETQARIKAADESSKHSE